MLNISVIILTYNEEKHIERCINNAKQFSNEIFLVDSFSSDRTVEIAESLGAVVVQNKWENNHARQFNFGLDNLPISNEWVFRLDADEYLTDNLVNELKIKFDMIPESVSGIVMERKMMFFDKMMNRGMIKMNILRLFCRRDGRCEDRWMDEHIVLSSGEIVHFDHVLIDHNLNNLGWWIQKHNAYSIREAIDLLDLELGLIPKSNGTEALNLSTEAESKRKKKLKYVKMPLFLRSFIYFIYRYIFKFGFTEGKIGFLWHFLQGWWYRTLVDAKVYEIKKHCGKDKIKIKAYIKENYYIQL